MSYCHMISPILSYKVCAAVSSLFPVCNCGLILYRKKEVMTRIINERIRVFSGLLKTFGLETASEFGNTTALFALLKTCYHKFLQRFPDRNSLYPESLFFPPLLYRGRRRPGGAGLDRRLRGGAKRPSRSPSQPLLRHTSSDKVRGWMGNKNGLESWRIFAKILWFCLA